MLPCINGWCSGDQQPGRTVVKVMAVRNKKTVQVKPERSFYLCWISRLKAALSNGGIRAGSKV